jgi:general secretion pathway protein D
MKRFCLLLFLVFVSTVNAWAAGVSVDLQRVGLADFCRVVYLELLSKSFVLDSSVVNDMDVFSVNLKNVSPDQLASEARRVLDLRGYEIDDKSGVLLVRRRQKVEEGELAKEYFVYRPLHRSVNYLLSISESMFKQGQFVGRRNQTNINFQNVSGGLLPGQVSSVPGVSPQASVQPVQLQGQHNVGLNAQTNVEQDVIVFQGAEKDVERLKKIFASVDIPVAELLVKAMVLEVQTTKKDVSAVDFVTSILKTGFGLNLAGGAAASAVGNVVLRVSNTSVDFQAIYSAFSQDNRFKVVTSPRVRVKSDSSARFMVGNETPILGSVSYDNNGRPIQSVEYKSSGVIFELKPRIRGATAELNVSQQLSQFVQTSNGVNNSPTLNKRELTTDVIVSDGDLILLGGLDLEGTTNNRQGLSFLPWFLDSTTDAKEKTEIVLMLQAERI